MAAGQIGWKERILQKMQVLSDEDFKAVFLEAFEQRRPVELKTFIQKQLKIMLEEIGEKEPVEGEAVKFPEPRSSKQYYFSDGKVPFLFRGDLIPVEEHVYIEVAKISLKKGPDDSKHQQVAGSVKIFNEKLDVILSAIIKWENICQIFPRLTGLTRENLDLGLSISSIRPFLELAFQRNIIVGWDLDSDLKCLGLDKKFKTLDLASHYMDESGQKRKLKDVLAHFKPIRDKNECSFQIGTQSINQGGASSVRDVHLATMDWMKYLPRCQVYPANINRSAKNDYTIDPDDPCWCPRKHNNQTYG